MTEAKQYPPSLDLQAARIQDRLDAMGYESPSTDAPASSPDIELVAAPEQQKPRVLDVAHMSDEQLAIIRDAYAASGGTGRRMIDMRGAISESGAFDNPQLFRVSNLELIKAAHETSAEIAERESRTETEPHTEEIDKLQSIIDDAEGYKQVYNLDDSDVRDLIDDSQARIAELTNGHASSMEFPEKTTASRSDKPEGRPIQRWTDSLNVNRDPESDTPVIPGANETWRRAAFEPVPRVDTSRLDAIQTGDNPDTVNVFEPVPKVKIPDVLSDNDTPDTGTEEQTEPEEQEETSPPRTWRDKFSLAGIAARAQAAAYAVGRELQSGGMSRTPETPESLKRRVGRRILGGVAAVAAGVAVLWVAKNSGVFPGGGGSSAAAATPDLMPSPSATGKAAEKAAKVQQAVSENFSTDALRVDSGEGLRQTLKDLGVPPEKWNATIKAAGPKLVKLGEVYQDNKVGYGINGDGQFSKKGLKILVDTAKNIK